MNRIERFKKDLQNKKAVKVIAGINNFDIEKVKMVVSAAHKANASAVDIAAHKDIIIAARQLTDLPIFVSSIVPEELAMAAQYGADAIEIGNFDALYAKGLRMDADEILKLTVQTMDLIDEDIFISVTVPGHIDIAEQIKLAQELETLGVNVIQTEGAAIANVESLGARGLMEKANVSIANTIELARNVEIPVMTASGISSTTASMAFAAGASAIGIGSCINKLNSEFEMVAGIKSVMEKVNEISFSKSDELVKA